MPQNKNINRRFERGNVFIYVFLGVILFAALMFTVNRSTNTMSTKMSQQQARAHAVAIMNYAKAVRNAVEKVQRNGIGEADISFENSVVSGYEHSPVAPDAGKIFHPLGGGMKYQAPNPDWLDSKYAANARYGEWYFPKSTCIHAIGETAAYNSCGTGGVLKNTDIILVTFYLKREICIELNKINGVGTAGAEPISDPGAAFRLNEKFQGVFGGTVADVNYSFTKLGGCLKQPSGTDIGYAFFYILVAR